jgi:hypothetical protein
MPLNTEKLSSDIMAAVELVVKKDIVTLEGFDYRHLAKLVRQSDNVATSIKSGKITGETRNFLVDGIRRGILDLVKGLQGLDVLTANRVYFAISVVVFKTISEASGFEIKP